MSAIKDIGIPAGVSALVSYLLKEKPNELLKKIKQYNPEIFYKDKIVIFRKNDVYNILRNADVIYNSQSLNDVFNALFELFNDRILRVSLINDINEDIQILFPNGVRKLVIENMINHGTIKIIGGILNNTRGLIKINDSLIISPHTTSTPALRVTYTRQTIIRDTLIVTDNVDLENNNIAPSSENPGTIGLQVETQSGEQVIIDNVITSGYEYGFKFNDADHVICHGCEARFTRVAFYLGRGFDYLLQNPHSFNGWGEAIMFQIGDEDNKPLNVTIENFHDENCQSSTCDERITLDIPKPDTYLTVNSGYISTQTDHVLMRTGYKSWASWILMRRIFASNPVNLIVRGQDGDLVIANHRIDYHPARFYPPSKLDYDIMSTLLGLYKQLYNSVAIGSGNTTVVSTDIPYNHGPNTILVLIKILTDATSVEQNIHICYTRYGPGDVQEFRQCEEFNITPGNNYSTFFIDTFDRTGYARIVVTIEGASSTDENTKVIANLLWMK